MNRAAKTAAAQPPPDAAADWTVPQHWNDYSAAEHAMWDRLYARQIGMLPGRVVAPFLQSLETLGFSEPGIPQFERLSECLRRLTGWSVVAVPGLVPNAVFFEHLANRRFVAGRFIRRPEQMDYLEEPDVFHDVFGHVPLLAHPAYADYMQAYGAGGLRSLQFDSLDLLSHLYWYTIEFGLMRERGALRLFGAGIVSSYSESIYALDDPRPPRIAFDLRRVLRTNYRIDTFQANYFVIESFEDLLRQTVETDFAPLYAELARLPAIPPGTVQAGDRLI
jgi:phenylalanine-4-hydroxylase